MSRRLRASLVAGAAVVTVLSVVTFYVNGWPGPHGPTIYLVTPTLVLLAYLGVGLAAWQQYPAERIGLLFTIVGYAWFLPELTRLHYPLPFTIGMLTGGLYQACLAHLALAWPYGRLRSRLDRAVVAVNYAWNIGNNTVALLVWNPRTNGCGAACPANLLLVDNSGRLDNAVDTLFSIIGICVTAAVVALIAWHWRQARGYARRAMTALIWVAVPIGGYIAVLQVAGLSLAHQPGGVWHRPADPDRRAGGVRVRDVPGPQCPARGGSCGGGPGARAGAWPAPGRAGPGSG